MNPDPCPNRGHCDCDAPLCDEGHGTDIYECVVDGRLHCHDCMERCSDCYAAVEAEVVA